MNKVDQDRLLELKQRVWAYVASQLIDPDNDPDEKEDQWIMFDSQIEGHAGRVGKAIRLLEEAGIIEKIPCKDTSIKRYKILKFEEAEVLGVKPEFSLRWNNHVDVVKDNMIKSTDDPQESLDLDTSGNTLTDVGYKALRDFSETEKIYIYYHQNELDVYKWFSGKNSGKEYYRKDLLTFRHKMVLKCLIELELLHNFPQYVGSYAGYDKSVIFSKNEEEFDFSKYAISSIFLKDEISSILSVYEKHNNKANLMLDAFNKTNAWVESVGGFPEAIKIIRKQIIEDFRANVKRFEHTLDYSGTVPQLREYSTRFKFINKHLDIFNYDTLYGDPNLNGEKVCNVCTSRYWSSTELSDPNIKEKFDESTDKGLNIEEEVA